MWRQPPDMHMHATAHDKRCCRQRETFGRVTKWATRRLCRLPPGKTARAPRRRSHAPTGSRWARVAVTGPPAAVQQQQQMMQANQTRRAASCMQHAAQRAVACCALSSCGHRRTALQRCMHVAAYTGVSTSRNVLKTPCRCCTMTRHLGEPVDGDRVLRGRPEMYVATTAAEGNGLAGR